VPTSGPDHASFADDDLLPAPTRLPPALDPPSTRLRPIQLVGAVGFEPTDGGSKGRCLNRLATPQKPFRTRRTLPARRPRSRCPRAGRPNPAPLRPALLFVRDPARG